MSRKSLLCALVCVVVASTWPDEAQAQGSTTGLSVVPGAGAAAASNVFVKDFGFENSMEGVDFVLMRNMSCGGVPCPAAEAALSTAAARSGSQGLRVVITSPGASRIMIKLESPRFVLDPGRMARFCFWARHNSSQARSARLDVSAMRVPAFVQLPNARFAQFFEGPGTWQRFCLHETEVTVRSVLYVRVDLGASLPGVIDIDDAELRVEDIPGLSEAHAWLAQTDARIREVRRGNLTLVFEEGTTGEKLTEIPGGLRLIMSKHDFLFGTAYVPEALTTARELAWYKQTILDFPFNALVTENIFKWPVYEPRRNSILQAQTLLGREYFNWANQSDIAHVRGHALEWFKSDFDAHWSRAFGCKLYPDLIRERITRDVQLYKGRFHSYDVLNEFFNEYGYPRRCGFNITLIADMFKWAAAADPTALMCINDYRLIEGDASMELVGLVSQLLQLGAPVQCIGIQAHLTLGGVSLAMQKARLDRLASLGLPLYITEVSLRTGWDPATNGPANTMSEDLQARWLDQLYRLWFSYPQIKGIWLWGWWDRVHWVPNGGIYTLSGQPKAGALALQRLLRTRWNTTAEAKGPVKLNASGSVRLTAFYGRYDGLLVMAEGRVVRFQVDFPASKGPRQTAVVRVPALTLGGAS